MNNHRLHFSPAKFSVIVLFTIGIIGIGISIADTASRDPSWYGLPDTLQGYKIVAIYTAQNTPCISPDVIQIVVQPIVSAVQAAPREINRTLRLLVRPRYAKVQFHIVTPDWSPKLDLIEMLERVKSKFVDHRCPPPLQLGPIISVTPRMTATPRKTPTP